MMKNLTQCKECGSTDLFWDYRPKNIGQATEGRLRSSEVTTVFFQGCNECSETISIVYPNDIVNFLNKISTILK